MSAANPKAQEPSMEEILASIRRIIADDQEGAKGAPPMPQPAPPKSPQSFPREEDVLDLGDIATPVPRSPALDLPQEDIGYRDAREMDFDTLQAPEEPPVAQPPAPPTPARPFEAEPASTFEAGPAPERLISSVTDSTVSSSFNMLSHTVLTQNARTLEDLVREMLKPMLKNWLDANLPGLVERLVRAEIERVTRGR
jgi:cell pole-organizing protein PopZ